MLEVELHRAGERDALDVPSHRSQILDRLRVIHSFDRLLDDRAFVEIRRHVVRRCADQLHAARMRLVVRLRTLEAGQEGVVDIDDPAGEAFAGRG